VVVPPCPRAAGARIVGKTNLHELAMLPIGTNPWFGTPVNPLDASLIPGGSSSGSAVAVATGEADVALGSDTSGSVRIPSACCGTAGLKTTYDRVPAAGVWPLAPSLDTVGPTRLEDLTPGSLVDIVIQVSQHTGLFNAAGVPGTAQPVRAAGSRVPASLQLVGPPRGEELLLATAQRIEAAMA
jgi:Asp-tRNA(Asn)/Glu-tRNA(Gln) amidotransferase A subunit family amidase